MAEIIALLGNEIARQFSKNPNAIRKFLETLDYKTEKSYEDIAKEIVIKNETNEMLSELAEIIVDAIENPAPETKKHIQKKNITYRNKKVLK